MLLTHYPSLLLSRDILIIRMTVSPPKLPSGLCIILRLGFAWGILSSFLKHSICAKMSMALCTRPKRPVVSMAQGSLLSWKQLVTWVNWCPCAHWGKPLNSGTFKITNWFVRYFVIVDRFSHDQTSPIHSFLLTLRRELHGTDYRIENTWEHFGGWWGQTFRNSKCL